MDFTTTELVDRIVDEGLTVIFEHSPTDFSVVTEAGPVLVAHDFNWPGWEAVLLRPDDVQVPLVDGPTLAGSLEWVVTWILTLAENPEARAA